MSMEKIVCKRNSEMEYLIFRHAEILKEQAEFFQLEVVEIYGDHCNKLRSLECDFISEIKARK